MLFLFVPLSILAAFGLYFIVLMVMRKNPIASTDFTKHTRTTHTFDMNAKEGAGWNKPRDRNNPTEISSHLV
jgi:hypothetical protein